MNPEEDTPRRYGDPGISEVQMDYRDVYPREPAAASPEREPLSQEGSSEKILEQPKQTRPSPMVVLKESDHQQIADSVTEDTKHLNQTRIAQKPVRPIVHKYGFVAGVAILLAALAGIVLIVCIAGSGIATALQNRGELQDWDTILDAVVWNDPAPFDQLADAVPEDLCSCAVRKAMQNLSDPERDELGRVLVPYADAESACKKLFGPDVVLQPQDGAFYTYDKAKNLFLVTPLPDLNGYVPETEVAEWSRGTIRLKVGYLSGLARTQSQLDASAVPEKWMEYTLKEMSETGQFYISAIRVWEEKG